jgi:hypothetical protein
VIEGKGAFPEPKTPLMFAKAPGDNADPADLYVSIARAHRDGKTIALFVVVTKGEPARYGATIMLASEEVDCRARTILDQVRELWTRDGHFRGRATPGLTTRAVASSGLDTKLLQAACSRPPASQTYNGIADVVAHAASNAAPYGQPAAPSAISRSISASP